MTLRSSLIVKFLVDMLSVSATLMRGRFGVTFGASPKRFLKCLSHPSFRFSAEPPWTVTVGLSFLPVMALMVNG